jgi:hypothetical protein
MRDIESQKQVIDSVYRQIASNREVINLWNKEIQKVTARLDEFDGPATS